LGEGVEGAVLMVRKSQMTYHVYTVSAPYYHVGSPERGYIARIADETTESLMGSREGRNFQQTFESWAMGYRIKIRNYWWAMVAWGVNSNPVRCGSKMVLRASLRK